MMSLIAPIATNLVMQKFGKGSQLPQTQLKAPPEVDLYRKFGRPQRRRASYYGQKSRPASVETGTYGPQSIYNSILKKQLGLLTSKA
mgnify:FL=1|tara:strand:+ start:1765 stop:2025 length:261 start_codon:yes stop_codon:yes gene_type:complete